VKNNCAFVGIVSAAAQLDVLDGRCAAGGYGVPQQVLQLPQRVVCLDDADRARSSRRRSYDDGVNDEHIAGGGCDRSGGQPAKVSSVFCAIVKSDWRAHAV
jgi:hypothetical protein